MKKTILTIVLAALWLNSKSQTSSLTSLNLGDQLPVYLWNTALSAINKDGTQTQIKLQEFRGKLIIVDFWATWCSSCIAGFPKLETIQLEFPDQLKVLLVTDEEQSKVTSFLKKRAAQNQNLQLQTVIADSLLQKVFPHNLIPHYVWIDQTGLVVNITASDAVSSEAIKLVLKGKKSQIQQKQDLNLHKPLFTISALPEDGLKYYSILLKGNYPGLPTGVSYRDKNDTLCGIAITNSSLHYIYETATTGQLPDYNNKRIVMDSSANNALIELHKSDQWNKDNLYSYEFRIPPVQSAQLYPQMLAQLNQVTGFKGTLIKKRIPCLVLSQSKHLLKRSTAAQRLNELNDDNELTIRNSSMLALSGRLNNAFDGLVIDETGINYPVNLQVKIYPNDIEKTNNALASIGLKLLKSSRRTKI
ncbi:MAG: TlpA family protein disulfide reductase, partial [Pedobacter sp.]